MPPVALCLLTRHDHSIVACSRHKHILLFFAHIPFVVNHTFNATPTDRLQHNRFYGRSIFLYLFRAILGKFGQKLFAPPEICLLLHLWLKVTEKFSLSISRTVRNSLVQWFPTGGSRPQSGSRRSFCGVSEEFLWGLGGVFVGSRRSFCGVANSSHNNLLKSRIFRTSYINILLHQQNRNTDRSLWSSHYLRHNSYLIFSHTA